MSNRLIDIITEPDNTITNMERDWTLEDLAEGCEFTVRKGGAIWVMGKPQGMDKQFVYCRGKVAKPARPGHRPIHRLKMFYMTQVIFSTDCA